MNMTVLEEVSWPDTAPKIERLRLPLVKRSLIVSEKFYLTPNMIRIVLTGEELAGFQSPSADDNIKIFTPDADGGTTMRSYTPRSFDAERKELVLDFAVHEAGPATQWALDVEIGDEALIGGPRGSKQIVGEVDSWLLIGDETALPAMLRRIEEASPEARFTLVASIPGQEDEQSPDAIADTSTHWLHRNGRPADEASVFIEALDKTEIAPGTFVWLAAEGDVTRTVRRYLNEQRGVPLRWIKATGYWVKGKADSTAKFED